MKRQGLTVILLLASTSLAQSSISSNLQGYGKVCAMTVNVAVDKTVFENLRVQLQNRVFDRLFLYGLTTSVESNFGKCSGKDLRVFFDLESYHDPSISRYVYRTSYSISPYSSVPFDFKSIWIISRYGTATTASKLSETFVDIALQMTDLFASSWEEANP